MKNICLFVVLFLISGIEAYRKNFKAGYWGWCPTTVKAPSPSINIEYELLTQLNGEGELNQLGDIKCTDDNIRLAGKVFEDENNEEMYGRFIGYPGGQCAFVTDEADCDMESAVDFLEVYYCTIQDNFCSTGKNVIMFPLAILFIVIAMWNLGSTADQYLSPTLEKISDKFQCSESLAGVTLLALGNGAPDVFAAIAAGGSEDGINIQVASLIGSSFFIVTFVLAVSLKAAKGGEVLVTKQFFIRDIVFL